MAESSTDVIKRYLEDIIAAEKSFETQFQAFSKEVDDPAPKAVFDQHAIETKKQYQWLIARLEALGGSASTAKSILAHIFGISPKAAQIGRQKEERIIENLMIAFAIENSELAMYEFLINVSEAAGDTETAALARNIKAQEKSAADKIWSLIPNAAVSALHRAGEKIAGSPARVSGG